jgi:hypothetical protein
MNENVIVIVREDLDGDRAAQSRIAGAVDLAHPLAPMSAST